MPIEEASADAPEEVWLWWQEYKQAQQTNRQRAVDASEDDVGNDLDPTYME
jgi:hypothetical protein